MHRCITQITQNTQITQMAQMRAARQEIDAHAAALQFHVRMHKCLSRSTGSPGKGR